MDEFPTLKTGAIAQHPASRSQEHRTCVLRFIDGTEQRFRERASALRKWVIRLDLLDEEEAARLEEFFHAQQGRLGRFAFTDPWTGVRYPDCSFEDDTLALQYQGFMRTGARLVVRENRG